MTNCPDCPPTSTSAPCVPPTPPGGSNCCLRTRYECEVILGVPTWVLDAVNTECVDNAECSPYSETCSDGEYSLEQQNGCVCFALPVPLPEPCCDPQCTTTTTTSTSTSSTSSTTTTSTTSTTTTTTTTTTTEPPCDPWTINASGSGDYDNTFTLPGMGACGGELNITASTAGQSPEGVVATVFANGGLIGTSGCLSNSGYNVSIPPNADDVRVVMTVGCGFGGDVASWTIAGSS